MQYLQVKKIIFHDIFQYLKNHELLQFLYTVQKKLFLQLF